MCGIRFPASWREDDDARRRRRCKTTTVKAESDRAADAAQKAEPTLGENYAKLSADGGMLSKAVYADPKVYQHDGYSRMLGHGSGPYVSAAAVRAGPP